MNPFSYAMSSPEASDKTPSPPNLFLLAMEFRAFWEFGAVLPSWPMLSRAPEGDGHAVLVFPGLSAGDASTIPLRRYLSSLGYEAHGWEQGLNFGPKAGVLENARKQVRALFESTGRKVSLIGWSLGGIYARELAKEMPELVRCAITLGTPFNGSPKSTNAWRVYELVSGRDAGQEVHNYDLPVAPSVPTTSVYSRTDGVVAWPCSIQPPSAETPNTENVEVYASHVGLGVNPSAWWVVADRLAQPEGAWQPFEPQGALQGLVFPDPMRN